MAAVLRRPDDASPGRDLHVCTVSTTTNATAATMKPSLMTVTTLG